MLRHDGSAVLKTPIHPRHVTQVETILTQTNSRGRSLLAEAVFGGNEATFKAVLAAVQTRLRSYHAKIVFLIKMTNNEIKSLMLFKARKLVTRFCIKNPCRAFYLSSAAFDSQSIIHEPLEDLTYASCIPNIQLYILLWCDCRLIQC